MFVISLFFFFFFFCLWLIFLIRFLRIMLKSVTIFWTFNGHVVKETSSWKICLKPLEAIGVLWSLCSQGAQWRFHLQQGTHFMVLLCVHLFPFHGTELLEGRKMSLAELGPQGVQRVFDLMPCVSHHCFQEDHVFFHQHGVSHTRGQGCMWERSFHAFSWGFITTFQMSLFV